MSANESDSSAVVYKSNYLWGWVQNKTKTKDQTNKHLNSYYSLRESESIGKGWM